MQHGGGVEEPDGVSGLREEHGLGKGAGATRGKRLRLGDQERLKQSPRFVCAKKAARQSMVWRMAGFRLSCVAGRGIRGDSDAETEG